MVRAEVAVVLERPNWANTASTCCWAGAISSGFSAEAAISPCAGGGGPNGVQGKGLPTYIYHGADDRVVVRIEALLVDEAGGERRAAGLLVERVAFSPPDRQAMRLAQEIEDPCGYHQIQIT